MYYDPVKRDHGLRHNPFLALVVPRPIGWISSLSSNGAVNVAPYSFYNAVSTRPPMVMFSSSTRKDTQSNAEHQGEFVVNLATCSLGELVNSSSCEIPGEVSEAELLGIKTAASRIVKVPRVAASPVALECRYVETVALKDVEGRKLASEMVVGQVVSIYIDDRVIVDGIVDMTRLEPLSRLGYLDYAGLSEHFAMERPR